VAGCAQGEHGLRGRNFFHPDLALGIFTFFIVASLPLFGVLAFLLASLWGWGTIVATRFGAAQGWSAFSFAESERESHSTLDNS
jgi:hypothetical protein